MSDAATIDCIWAACRDGDQDHDAVTAPSAQNPGCACHKIDGLRLVHRHEERCPLAAAWQPEPHQWPAHVEEPAA